MRLVDRWLNRAAGYNEAMYSGAYYVTAQDSQGRGREGAPAGFVRHAREAFAENGVVFACIAARMALFSEARFQYQSTIDKHLFGNTDLSILEYPWPNATAGELLARMEQDISTAGNSYIRRAVPADGTDAQLVQMRPDCVTVVSEQVRDEAGRIFKRPVGYLEDLKPLGIMDRDPQLFDVDEVAHYTPVSDEQASFIGKSWIASILREVGADRALTQYKATHVSNGALPGLVLKYSQKLSQASVDRLRQRFSAKFGGAENAGKTLVLDEGADVVVAGSTLEQLQFTAVQQAGERRICAAASVPLEIVGLKDGDYQSAMRRFADLWARPHWRMVCASLQHLLPDVQAPTRLWYDTADIAALREGELERSQATLVRAQAVGAFVTAGYTRESAIAAAESGDLSQLQADPNAGVPGSPTGVRPPQAAKPEALPGVVSPNRPNSQPWQPPPMPSLPNGARG